MKLTIFSFLLLLQLAAAAQTGRMPDGGGHYADFMHVTDELSAAQRAAIITMLQKNEGQLKQLGSLPARLSPTAQSFGWPLKQGLNYNDPGFYGISNYIDHNAAFPNQVTDYNCGTRSYDLSSGYNHKGTDIFTWPYGWQKMANNAVEIVACAPGTIIGKSDGNFDQNCAFCSGACNWNAVYVMHADGSVAWYGHMKSGSLTPKANGQTVAEGEYLGVVGSSGNSTGPHLHLEVYTNSSYTQLVDPWAGACNATNGTTSWWANQQPYYVSTINKVMTHGAAPQTGQCPAQEIPNEKINFIPGQVIYLSGYYRDQQNGQQSVHRVFRPDGSLHTSWTQNFTSYYAASWWYYSLTLPANAAPGTWRYEVTYNVTQKASTAFIVSTAALSVCRNNSYPLSANITGTSFQWQVNSGAGFTNIEDGILYSGTNTAQLMLKNLSSGFYNYQYRCVADGSNFSNIITLKFTSYWQGGKSGSWEDPQNWNCGNIPDANTDVVINAGSFNPLVSSLAECRSITLQPGTDIQVNTGYKLNVRGGQ
ncbi:MAG: peptidoglycan DD-metalloendopeptidase family protein [Ferruginibacter sp.]